MTADARQKAARPHDELIRELLDSRVPKNEREHAAAREIERLRSMTEVTMGIGSGDGNLFVHGDYESIKAAQAVVLERDALRAEAAEWKRVASAQAGLHDEAEARVKRLEKMLGAYKAAVNKIDDLIEYSLPMPSGTKAALYAVLANLTEELLKENKA